MERTQHPDAFAATLTGATPETSARGTQASAAGLGQDTEVDEDIVASVIRRNVFLSMFAKGEGDSERAPPETRIGRYRVVRVIDSGAMGVVLEARDETLGIRVAIKQLKTEEVLGGSGSGRLLREAQAIAQIRDPNVIPIYSADEHEGRLYIVMDFAEGSNLRAWQRGRSWRELVDHYLLAGRGLAAVHARGFVHRDFKPDNVLIDEAHGRVLLADFGLVCRPRALEQEAGGVGSRDVELDALNLDMTRTNQAVGTIRYMSPEQLSGARVDGRSDQFSFCAALFEALHGRAAYPGDTAKAVAAAIARGALAPTENRAVPRRLNAALRGGLDPDPTRRFESMAALLRALDYRRRRRQAAIGGGVVAIACVGALVGARLVSPRCDGGEALVAAAWNEEVERDITSKFATPGDERAAEAVARATKRLGEYASTWAKVHRDVCEATDKHRYQTEGDRATRMRCLDQRLHELKAVTDEAIAGRTASADDLVYAAASLALSQPCAKATAYPQPPPEAEERVRAVEQLIAESVAAELSSGVNGEGAGYQRAMQLATQAVERAQTIGYAPLLAQALTRRARMQWLTEDDKGGIESLEDALDLAAEIEAVDIEADASTLLVKIAALGTRDDVRGEVWARQAQRVVQRLADDPLREAELLNNRGLLRMLVRDYPGAIQLHKQALELREAVPNAIFERADSHLNLGAALGAARKHREAIEHYEQGIALQRDPIGADHPRIAVDSYNTALELIHLGEYQEALSWLDRVESVYRATYGPNSLKLVRLHQARADALDGTGQTERALAELERAQAILEASDEVDLYEFALVLRSKGHVQQNLGDLPGADQTLHRAVELLARSDDPGAPALRVVFWNDLGELLSDNKRYAEAREYFSRAKEAAGAMEPPLVESVHFANKGIGRSLLEEGRPGDAIAPLQVVLAALKGDLPLLAAEVNMLLARALVTVHREPELALVYAQSALDYYKKVDDEEFIREASEWRDKAAALRDESKE